MAVALAITVSPAAFALTHSGGASVADTVSVKVFDASNASQPILTQQTEALAQTGAFVFSHDALFVADGSQVRRYDRRDLTQPASARWAASSPVLAVADGNERGLVLVLESAALSLVRFSETDAPAAVWSYPVSAGTGEANPGRILIRDGNRAFVADASLPGVRVVSIDPDKAPETIATYASPDGAIHEMSLWGDKLTLAADAGLAVVRVSAGDAPVLDRVGAMATGRNPVRVDANSRYALVADGQTLNVVDIDPSSPGFLGGAVDAWQAPADIRSVRLDKDMRAYALVQGAYEILDVAAYGGR